MIDRLIKRSSTGSQTRSPSSLKKIYDQLRQTYYNQFLHPQQQDNTEVKKIRRRSKQQIKKIIKILPNISKKQQNLTTKEIDMYLTNKQLLLKNQETSGGDIDPVHSNSKSNNRQLKAILFPNRLNSLRLTRYFTKRKSQQPYFRQSQDIIITKQMQILQSQRDTTSATETIIKSKKKSVLFPIKHLVIKKCKQKAKQVQLPVFISFKDFSTLIKQYQYIQVKQECFQYKAYVGKGNNSGLIKRLLKQKGYWTIVDKFTQDIHFVWTQTKNNYILNSLRKRQLASSSLYFKQQTKYQLKNKEGKQQYCSISKILSSQMLDNILKQKDVSRKINIHNLITQIKSRRKNMTILSINQNSTFANHVDQASCIGNKKALLYHMTQYYNSINRNPFQVIPQTIYLVKKPSNVLDLKNIVTFGTPCILKPASGTNRGTGITIHTSLGSLYSAIQETSNSKGFVIQRYLSPFLYKNRKFDIRIWVLWCNGQAWWYNQGYLRTSSKQYNLKTCNRFVHLTNDAVQKKSQNYGKFEAGNKLSFADFQKYLDENNFKYNFSSAIQQMKSITKDLFKASSPLMDKDHKAFSYELFGLDFMIDKDFKVWLIEANTNPCLQTSCSLLNRLITNMLQGVLNLTIDIVFPPPKRKIFKDWSITNFKFELLYDNNEIWNKAEQMKQVKFQTDQQQYENNQQE